MIALNGDSAITLIVGDNYVDAGATASDAVDGTVAVTSAIKNAAGETVKNIDTSSTGVYTITYNSKDNAGNTSSAIRTVTVTNTLFQGRTQLSRTVNNLVGGAREYTIVSTDSNSWPNTSYISEINLAGNANYKIMSCYGTYDGSKCQMVTLSDQAAAAQAYFNKTPGCENYKVVGILNADFFNMATGEPTGALVMNGVKYHDVGGEPYFAVLNNGTMAIRDSSVPLNDCISAVGGNEILLKNGVIKDGLENVNDGYRNLILSRSAIGLKKDGTVVTLCTHGFIIPDSYGLTYYDVAAYLKAMGCTDALMLDGGGSTEWCSMYEGSSELKVRNTPSDGNERLISSSIMLVATPSGDNDFNHATIAPNNETYTPGSSVKFTATGVSNSGGSAPLPESGLSWKLDDSCKGMGTIDSSSGVFTTVKGVVGKVTVDLIYDQKTVGTTTITLADPDQLFFNTASISLDWGEKSNLGLNVKANSMNINYKDGDFTWTVKSTTDGVDNIGFVSNNMFTASADSKTLTGTVTVAYKKTDGTILKTNIDLIIGKLPQVLCDFEGDTVGEKTAQYCWGDTAVSVNGYGYNDDSVKSPVTIQTSYTEPNVMSTLTKPYKFDGNWDSAVPAGGIFGANGYRYYTWVNSAVPNPESSTAEIVSSANGKVRFGEHALALNYDYTKFTASCNGSIAIRYCGNDINIEGNPKAIGMWVYAPEGTPNYWLYTWVSYWDGTDYDSALIQFKTMAGTSPQYTGINWNGWMYLEGDLSSIYGKAKEVNSTHPLKIINGSNIICLGYINSTSDGSGHLITCGSKTAGTIYIDNIRAVYGSTADDLVSPVISSVTANGNEINKDNSTVITSNNISFVASYSDPDSANRTGINKSSLNVEIDGVKANVDAGDSTGITRVNLANGTHSILVKVADGFGNLTTEMRYFTVKCEQSSCTSMELTGNNSMILGSKYSLELSASQLNDLSNVTLNAAFKNEFGTPTVNFENGYRGNSTYNKGALTVTASRDSNASSSGDGVVATIEFSIPENLAEGTAFTYSANISYTTLKEGEQSFACQQSVPVKSAYLLNVGVMVIGSSGTIEVKDVNSKTVNNVSLYAVGNSGDSLLGTTDSNGSLTVNTAKLCGENDAATSKFTIYAKGENGVSYRYTGKCLMPGGNADGTPSEIQSDAVVKNAETQKCITWMSNPIKTNNFALARIMTEDNYKADSTNWSTIDGKSTLYAFSVSGDAARLNSVLIEGLIAGTKYAYQVGDGTTWSDVQYFTTNSSANTTNFFVIGDTQLSGSVAADSNSISIINGIAGQLKSSNLDYAFGIQTGDFVDNGGTLPEWKEILDTFTTAFPGTDFIHVMGNHEYYGDASGDAAGYIYNIPGKDYYSVQYGSVYVAVINNCADLNKAAAWLINDAKSSSAKWKVLTLHQPPYYTNILGSNEAFNKIIPPAAEQAGINVVFCGHDHSYARTEPLTKGKVSASYDPSKSTSKKDDGIVYYICGDLGEKSRNTDYSITNNPDFHFAMATQNYTAAYIVVSASDNSLKVTTFDEATGTAIDSYAMNALD